MIHQQHMNLHIQFLGKYNYNRDDCKFQDSGREWQYSVDICLHFNRY